MITIHRVAVSSEAAYDAHFTLPDGGQAQVGPFPSEAAARKAAARLIKKWSN